MLLQLFCTAHLLLATTKSQITVKQTSLTPSNTHSLGSNILYNYAEVAKANNAWVVNMRYQSSWQFIINADSSWGFDPDIASSISLTLNAPFIGTPDFLFGFTTNNQQFISMKLPMDNSGRATSIYPGCSTNTIGVGDIASLPDFNRECDISGGSCTNWQTAPFNTENLVIQPPITITLENDPPSNTLYIYLSSVNYVSPIATKCKYAALPAESGVKFYIAGNKPGQSFTVTSFELVSTVRNPTPRPTQKPSLPTPPVVIVPPVVTTPPVAVPHPVLPQIPGPPVQPPQPVQPAHPVPPNPPHVPTTTTTTTTTTTVAPITTPLVTPGAGEMYGAFAQICAEPTTNSVCSDTTDIATHSNGITKCERPSDCCLCSAIQCGNIEVGCVRFSAGPHGAFGVGNIGIEGDKQGGGTMIDCFGTEACSYATITAENVISITAASDLSLANAKVSVTNPMNGFGLECTGNGGCSDSVISLEIPGPPVGYECNAKNPVEIIEIEGIECGGSESCKNMQFSLKNNGCNPVEIATLDCVHADSCTGASFNFVGNVNIANCGFKGAARGITGIDKCFENLEMLLCPDPTSCGGAVRTLTNPMNGFMLNCGNGASCAGAHFTINIEANVFEPVESFEMFKFSGKSAGEGAVITVNNKQANELRIQRIECTSAKSCEDTTIVVGTNVSVGEIVCVAGACNGCTVKRNLNSEGIPCDPDNIPPFTAAGQL